MAKTGNRPLWVNPEWEFQAELAKLAEALDARYTVTVNGSYRADVFGPGFRFWLVLHSKRRVLFKAYNRRRFGRRTVTFSLTDLAKKLVAKLAKGEVAVATAREAEERLEAEREAMLAAWDAGVGEEATEFLTESDHVEHFAKEPSGKVELTLIGLTYAQVRAVAKLLREPGWAHD